MARGELQVGNNAAFHQMSEERTKRIRTPFHCFVAKYLTEVVVVGHLGIRKIVGTIFLFLLLIVIAISSIFWVDQIFTVLPILRYILLPTPTILTGGSSNAPRRTTDSRHL